MNEGSYCVTQGVPIDWKPILRTLSYTTLCNGNALNNMITGSAFDNILDGGGGSDIMSGGQGNDTYVVDVSGDIITEKANEGNDTVHSSFTYTLGGNVEHLSLTGTTDINGYGNELGNTMFGNSGSNVLNGGSGNDFLDGGFGIDTMSGGLEMTHMCWMLQETSC